jgi:hypothetical protein
MEIYCLSTAASQKVTNCQEVQKAKVNAKYK